MIISFDGGMPTAERLLGSFEDGRGMSLEMRTFFRAARRTLPCMKYVLFSGSVRKKEERRGVFDTAISIHEHESGFTVSVTPQRQGMTRREIERSIAVALRMRVPLFFDPKRTSVIITIPADIVEDVLPLPDFRHGFLCFGMERTSGGWSENFRLEYHLVEGRTTAGSTVLIMENGFKEEADILAQAIRRALPRWNIGRSDLSREANVSIVSQAWRWEKNNVIFFS